MIAPEVYPKTYPALSGQASGGASGGGAILGDLAALFGDRLLVWWRGAVSGDDLIPVGYQAGRLPQVKGTVFAGNGSNYGTADILTTDTIEVTAGSGTPTCTIDGRLDVANLVDVWEVTVKRAGVVIAIWPMMCLGGEMELDTSGNGNSLVFSGSPIEERADGTGTNRANEDGFSNREWYLRHSADFTNALWIVSNGATKDGADQITLPAVNGAGVWETLGSAPSEGDVWHAKVEIKGAGQLSLWIEEEGTWTVSSETVVSTADDWTEVEVMKTIGAGATDLRMIQFRTDTGNSDTGGTFQIRNARCWMNGDDPGPLDTMASRVIGRQPAGFNGLTTQFQTAPIFENTGTPDEYSYPLGPPITKAFVDQSVPQPFVKTTYTGSNGDQVLIGSLGIGVFSEVLTGGDLAQAKQVLGVA